jgi:hypothetical protein
MCNDPSKRLAICISWKRQFWCPVGGLISHRDLLSVLGDDVIILQLR